MEVARGTLSGECKATNGEWRATSLNIRQCPQGADIANDNGALKCLDPTPAAAPPAPPPPPPPPASPPPPPTEVSPPPPPADATPPTEVAPPPPAGSPPQGQRQPPEGSYQKTCRNFTVERGTLKAECQDATGAYKETSIALRACRGAPDITNEGGTLKCVAPAQVP